MVNWQHRSCWCCKCHERSLSVGGVGGVGGLMSTSLSVDRMETLGYCWSGIVCWNPMFRGPSRSITWQRQGWKAASSAIATPTLNQGQPPRLPLSKGGLVGGLSTWKNHTHLRQYVWSFFTQEWYFPRSILLSVSFVLHCVWPCHAPHLPSCTGLRGWLLRPRKHKRRKVGESEEATCPLGGTIDQYARLCQRTDKKLVSWDRAMDGNWGVLSSLPWAGAFSLP